MNDIISKLSSYNIFNHLFPGAVFCVIAGHIGIMPSPDEIIDKIFWFYFVGMAISRIGSIVVEPLLIKLNFLPRGEYKRYLKAREKDSQIEVMVEVLNTYRTVMTMFLTLICGVVLATAMSCLSVSTEYREYAALVGLLLLFLFSTRKQAQYVKHRIEYSSED